MVTIYTQHVAPVAATHSLYLQLIVAVAMQQVTTATLYVALVRCTDCSIVMQHYDVMTTHSFALAQFYCSGNADCCHGNVVRATLLCCSDNAECCIT